MLVVRDGVGMAYMERPFAPYLSLGVYPERFDRLRGPMVSPGGDLVLCFFQVWPGEAGSHPRAVVLWFLCQACGSGWSCGSGGPCLGHILSDQEPYRRARQVSSVRARLICIKWERERVSRSAILPSPIGMPFPNYCSLFLK